MKPTVWTVEYSTSANIPAELINAFSSEDTALEFFNSRCRDLKQNKLKEFEQLAPTMSWMAKKHRESSLFHFLSEHEVYQVESSIRVYKCGGAFVRLQGWDKK